MNTESGEIKLFDESEQVPKGWVEWVKDEVVEIKGCHFKVAGINLQEQQLILKAISKKEAMLSKLGVKLKEFKG